METPYGTDIILLDDQDPRIHEVVALPDSPVEIRIHQPSIMNPICGDQSFLTSTCTRHETLRRYLLHRARTLRKPRIQHTSNSFKGLDLRYISTPHNPTLPRNSLSSTEFAKSHGPTLKCCVLHPQSSELRICYQDHQTIASSNHLSSGNSRPR